MAKAAGAPLLARVNPAVTRLICALLAIWAAGGGGGGATAAGGRSTDGAADGSGRAR
jgi:hypothetical protein